MSQARQKSWKQSMVDVVVLVLVVLTKTSTIEAVVVVG